MNNKFPINYGKDELEFIFNMCAMSPYIKNNSDYKKLRKERYASFDSGKGAEFETGELTLEDLREIAYANGEPRVISGKQELYEALINMYI